MINSFLKNRFIRPIGLDIGHNSIKMLQLAANRQGRIIVHAADEIKIDPELREDQEKYNKHVVSSIKQALADGKFYSTNTMSCLSSGDLKITSLRLSEAEGFKTQLALGREVVQRFGLDPEKDSLDYIIAGDVRQGEEIKKELILFAASYETINNHIKILEMAGLKPVGIDTVPGALFRCFERNLRRQEDRENAVIFIDIGCTHTTVVIGRTGEINFIKQIEIGEDDFNRQVAAKLDIKTSEAAILRCCLAKSMNIYSKENNSKQNSDDSQSDIDSATRQVIIDTVGFVAEKLAREIALCLRYYTVTFRGRKVERAVISGGGAYEKILLDVLQRQLSVNIEYAQPLRGFEFSANSNFHNDSDQFGLYCQWAVVVGLGMKGLTPDNSCMEMAECQR